MKGKYVLILFVSLFMSLFILSLNLVSAINLNVNAKPVSNAAITDLNEPAVFDLIIENLEGRENFEIYSLVGFDMSPETFTINAGETKTIRIEVMPQYSVGLHKGFSTFEYIIRNSKNEIQKENLNVNILDLAGAFSITPGNINPKSEKIDIAIKNNVNFDFDEMNVKIISAFFDFDECVLLSGLETKNLEVPIDNEKSRVLDSGNYLMNTKITVKGVSADKDSVIKFLGQEDIETIEIDEGIIVRRYEITKKNVGNVRKVVKISADRDLFSYLFTTVNIAPTRTEINGFTRSYFWEKELIPNEELKVVVKTNWFYPLIVVLLAVGLFILIKRNVERDLMLRKKVSFVKTKGGQFALKVRLRVKSKKFLERISVIDKLPPLVKLYHKYGAITPDKIDLKNRRIEWNIESLNEGEERIFSYIIYSKIGVVGRFELPSAKAIYEREGKVKETISNRSFFINEPKKS